MDFEKLRCFRNRNNPFAQLMGITLAKIEEGTATAVLEVKKEFLNPVNACHGGVYFTLADVASGAAAASFGSHVVTVSSDYHYLNSVGEGQTLKAVAETVKCGRKLIVLRVLVTACGNEKPIGAANFTYYRLDQEIVL